MWVKEERETLHALNVYFKTTLEKCQLPVNYLTGQALPRGKQESVCDFEKARVPFWLFLTGTDLGLSFMSETPCQCCSSLMQFMVELNARNLELIES